uniref:Uncharacterized protein n=1 Tax=Amphiprion percula TaxID=161767 RepID=A0A3P8UBR9_AMPPE
YFLFFTYILIGRNECVAYLTTEIKHVAAALTGIQEIHKDYTCPQIPAPSSKYKSDMLVRYEPPRPLRSSSSVRHS